MPAISDNFDNNLEDVDFGSEYNDSSNTVVTPSSSSSLGVLQHNNKKYAVGLTWLSRNSLEDTSSDRKKAQALNADFTCNRNFADQCGYGYLNKGHRIAMSSMAALAADALVGEWHGVFEADNGWLYIAVHSDNIAPDGDLFFYSEQEAYNHFMAQVNTFKWPKTYVPESWNIKSNDGEISLDKFVDGGSTTNLSPANLDAIFYGKTNKFLFFAICIAFLTIFIIYSNIKPSLVNEADLESPAASADIGLLKLPPKEIFNVLDGPSAPLIKNNIIAPSIVVQNCMRNIDELSQISIPGWPISSAICTEQQTTVNWKRQTGDFTLLRQYTQDLPKHLSLSFQNDTGFSISLFPSYDTNVFQEVEPKSKDEIFTYISTEFSRLGTIQLVEGPSTNSDNTSFNSIQSTTQAIAQNIYPTYNFTLSTKLSPQELKEKFNFPSIKFNKIEWNIENGQWLYDTIIYGNATQQQGIQG